MLETGGFWETPGIDNLEYRVMNSKGNLPQNQDKTRTDTQVTFQGALQKERMVGGCYLKIYLEKIST